MAANPTELESVLEAWSASIRRKDIDALMALYSPSIVYFDVVPPLHIEGLDAVRRNFVRWFDMWNGPIGVEIREMRLCEGGELAAAHMLHRTSGRLKVGHEVDYWLRATVHCEKLASGWRISHEHVSLPIDFAHGTAVMDLQP